MPGNEWGDGSPAENRMIEQLTGRDLIGTLLRETGPALRPPLVEPSSPER